MARQLFTLSGARSGATWQHHARVAVYTLLLFGLQALWIPRIGYPALRVDLLLPLMFGIAPQWPPLVALAWAFVWGFVLDTFSGKLWGFHVGSYLLAVLLVNVAMEKLELQNPFYQMSFVGMCALCQSAALGAFLLVGASGPSLPYGTWFSLLIRAALIMMLSPLIIYPIWNARRVGG